LAANRHGSVTNRGHAARFGAYARGMGFARRVLFAGAVYHVTARGNSRQLIFRDRLDRELFLDLCADVVEGCRWRCHAYCLMGNHYHLLVETPEPNLPAGLQRLNSLYARRFNRAHVRRGHLFESRCKTILVERQSHLLELARYVVLNPVRAGLCGHPADWPWSSYPPTAGLAPAPELLTTDWILGQFATRDAARRYRRFVEEGPRRSPWKELRRRTYLGSREFARAHPACPPTTPSRARP
jgi:putative transposase